MKEAVAVGSVSYAESRATDRFRHEVAFYRGLDGLVETLLPFVREGVALGEPVLVALLPDRLAAFREALGADAARVGFVDMAELGANPARIIPEWRSFLDSAGEGPVRGVGEPVWSGRRQAELDEALLHEMLLNTAFDEGPPWRLLCPYDVSALPGPVIEDALRTHPVRHELAGLDLPAVDGPGPDSARTWFAQPLSAPPPDADVFHFSGEDLAGLRSVVGRLSDQAGLSTGASDDMVLAAHELATNSVVHGAGGGTLTAWTESGAFVVNVRDPGRIDDPLVGRDLITGLAENGRGVWMANQLCDLVQVRSGVEGTEVRIFAWR
jgi:anti-sigma regulatory factor (Ser/Thr protein kinase)